MLGEDAEDALEVASVHDQEPVEALGADGADEALGDRVRLRRPHRRLDDSDAFAGEDGVEVTGELAVAVADQELGVYGPLRIARVRRGDRWGKRGGRIDTISPGIIFTPLARDELTGPRSKEDTAT